MPSTGETIDRYVIEAVLGEGGMGRIYRAFDPRLGRRVALKVLLPGGDGDKARADAVARMMREARAAAAFNHPNVVAIYDVGEVEGHPYIVMELVAGATLRSQVSGAQATPAQKLAWLLDVARGLGAAHRAGLVHRDIKPENVMITEDGVVKILDFGIARRAETDGEPAHGGAATEAANFPSITAEGLMLGTPQYMAPEQLQGEPLDGRADQFAWGVMAWELFAGTIPWSASKTGPQLIAAILATPARSLRDFVPEVEERVSEAVARALSKKREARFATMEDLLAAIEGKRVSLVSAPSSGDVAYEPTLARPSGPDVTAAPNAAQTKPSERPPPLTTGAPVSQAPAATDGATARALRRLRVRKRWLLPPGLSIAALAVGVATVAVRRPQVSVCLSATEGVDGPRCVGEIPPEFLARRLWSHRVVRAGTHVQKVEAVSFTGRPEWDSSVVRGSDGSVREIVAHDHDGTVVRRELWSDGGRHVDLVDDDGVTPRHWEGRITGLRREFDERGRITKETYVGATGRPRMRVSDKLYDDAAYGAYAYGYAYGRHETWTRRVFLAADGDPGATTEGVSAQSRSDDADGFPRERNFRDLDDHPVADPYGVSHYRWLVDDALVEAGLYAFDAHDEPTVMRSNGAYGVVQRWDGRTHVLEVTWVDERGRPRVYKANSFGAIERGVYDERGRLARHEFLDANRNLVVRQHDVATNRFTWDEHNDQIALEGLDPAGALLLNSDGYARLEQVNDPRGNPTEIRYFDEARRLAPRSDGGAIWRMTYDDRGLKLTESYFDASDHPVANVHGYASTHNKYDRLRNLIEEAHFGPDGRPCVDDEGVSVKRSTYDENDDLVAVAYLDANGDPTMYKGEYAAERLVNDERGLVKEEEYLDGHDNPTLRKDGYAVVRYVRDRNGDVVEEAYFGKHEEPVVRAGGYAKKRTRYDVRRHPVETSLFDASGAPTVGSDGWAVERTTWDERGLVVRVDHFDAGNQPTLTKTGSASEVTTYDARGNAVAVDTLGKDGKPIATSDGYATKKSTYDDRDELIEESLFGAGGKPSIGKDGWSVHRLRYDDVGNLVEEAFFDGDRQPVAPKDTAYTSVRSRFDARQRLVESDYFDASGAPGNGPEGVATVRYTRDEYGHVTETSYLDGAGRASLSKDGTLVVRAKYDDAGRVVEELFVDAAGAPLVAKDGCAGHRTKYDVVGRKLEESCLDAKGAPTIGGEGWAVRRTLHDARGNAVDVATYDANGALLVDKDGVARRRMRFDERNLVRETAFFDSSDRPAHDKHGVSVTRFAYDDSGKKTRETRLDERGRVLK